MYDKSAWLMADGHFNPLLLIFVVTGHAQFLTKMWLIYVSQYRHTIHQDSEAVWSSFYMLKKICCLAAKFCLQLYHVAVINHCEFVGNTWILMNSGITVHYAVEPVWPTVHKRDKLHANQSGHTVQSSMKDFFFKYILGWKINTRVKTSDMIKLS